MKILTWLSRRRFPYEPLISVEISRRRLLANLAAFQKIAPGKGVATVLKSNAYGHGLFEIASILEKEKNIPFFIVDSYFEAIALRSRGIHTALLVIGFTRPETIISSHLKNVAFTVTSLETLKNILGKSRGKNIHIHLKIDTGMHRQGVLESEVDAAINLIKNAQGIVLDGICSHLCDADNNDPAFTQGQIKMWNALVQKCTAAFPGLSYIHLANTDGHRYDGTIEANVSRLGVGLYGLSENTALANDMDLVPVLEMKTILTSIKPLQKGESVGYSNTFTAARDMTIATIPVGYFEGVDRRLSSATSTSGGGIILVGPDRIPCPIIGRVSMNITSIDISNVPGAHIGMTAVAVSNRSSDENSIVSIAKKCATISYEIVVHIPAHLKRKIVD